MLLAIDTASAMVSLAIFDGQQIVAEYSFRSENQHTRRLSPAIQQLFEGLNLHPSALTCLALSQGYGSYSGLRVGFGVAKGLASALSIPLIPIPTLDIVASSTPYVAGRDLYAVIPAGRKRMIAGLYVWEDGGWRATGDILNAPWEELLPLFENKIVNGEIHPVSLPSPWGLRRAGFLAFLAWQAWQRGDFSPDLATINPLYLREP